MSMYRVVSCVLEEGVCYDQCILLAKLLGFDLLHFVLQAKFACYSRYLLTSYFYIPIPYDEKDIFFVVSPRRSCRSS